ncbi:MAG: helix-turn-helix transcriptional regulator [Ruminococcus sp.]|nr:helix-turn-helix transcriptional regulator [Ruminococcus sp.]
MSEVLETAQTLASACYNYRKAHALSREAMAQLCGVHFNTIYHCERGHRLWAVNQGKIERILRGGENNERV